MLTDYTQSFEVILASTSIYDCVQSCFGLRCMRAAFTHFPRSACLLHFSPLERSLDEGKGCETNVTAGLRSDWEFGSVPEVVQIDCIRCNTPEPIAFSNSSRGASGNNGSAGALANGTAKASRLRDMRPVDITRFQNDPRERRELINPQGN